MIKRSEANLAAEFYHQAKLNRLNCVLELSTPKGRLDIAIINHAETHIYAIVECKNGRQPSSRSGQMVRYRKLGLPLLILTHHSQVSALVEQAMELLDSPGILISQIMAIPREYRAKRLAKRKALIWLDEDLNIKHLDCA